MAKQDNFIPSNANIIESLVASITNQEMLVEFISNSADNIVKIIESTKGKITKDSLESIQQLDVCISSLNNIISSICELKIKDALTLPMKLPILEQSLVILMNSLSSMADRLVEMEEFQIINKKLTGVITTLNTLKSIIDEVTNFPKIKIKDIIQIHTSLSKLFFVIKTICNKVKKNLSKLEIDPNVISTIESIKMIIDNLNMLAENLIKFSKTSMKLLLVSIPLIIGLFTTLGIVWVIIKILGVFKMLNGFLSMVNVTLTIKSLNEVIGGLKKLAEDLIKFAGISAILILISPVVILGVLFTLLIIKAIIFLITHLISLSKSAKLIQAFIVIFIIKKLLVEMLQIIGLLFLLALAALIMIKFYEILLLGLLAIVVVMSIIAGIALVLKLVAKVISFSIMAKIFLFMVLLFVLIGFIFLMALMLIKITAMKNDILSGFSDFVIVTGIILGIGLALSLLGFALASLIPGMVMTIAFIGIMFISIVLILLLAASLKLLTKMNFTTDDVKIIKDNIKNIMEAAHAALNIMLQEAFGVGEEDSGFRFLGTLFKGLGAIIELVLICAFVALTLVAIALVILLALTLKLLVKINFSKNEVKIVKENVKNIITTASEVILAVMSPFEDIEKDESKQSTIDKIMEAILPDWLNTMLRALGTILMLIPTIIAVGLVVFLSKVLGYLKDVVIDETVIISNVNNIINSAHQVIYAVNNPSPDIQKDDSKKGLLNKLAHFISPSLGSIMDAMDAALFLIPILSAVGMLSVVVDGLNKIAAFNIKESDIQNKITLIKNNADSLIKMVGDQQWEDIDLKDAKYRVKIFENIVDVIENLSGIENVSSELSSVESLFKQLTSITDKQINNLGNLYTILNNLGDLKESNAIKLIESSDKFIQTIRDTDLSKLETAEKIFKNMAEFSQSIKGDFDALAEALTEKIAPLLEGMNENLEKIPNKMDEQVAQQEFENAPVNTPAGALRELFNKFNPSASEEEIDKRVSQKVTQQSQQNNAILETNELLTEIRNILKSQMI